MNLLLVFTLNISLGDWEKSGILDREVVIYKELSKKGINVSFFTYGDKSDLIYRKRLKEINIILAKNKLKSKRFSLLKGLLFPIFNRKLFKNIDIIKTNQMDGSWLTWFSKIFYRKKIILRCGFEHYKILLEEQDEKSKFKIFNYRLFSYFIIQWISYTLADHIILTNNVERNFVIKHFKINPKKITVLPNYIDISLFRPINMKKKEKAILFIGSLNRHKNLENLIKSIKILGDFSLDIIGKGVLKPKLTELIRKLDLQSKIYFLDIIPNSKLPDIINQYEIFILPSITEGNPKSLLEAMSCGLACIGSNIPGIKQILTHKKTGFICNIDSNSIAKAIMEVYQNLKLRQDIGKNARNFIIENCALENIVLKEYNLYKSLFRN